MAGSLNVWKWWKWQQQWFKESIIQCVVKNTDIKNINPVQPNKLSLSIYNSNSNYKVKNKDLTN